MSVSIQFFISKAYATYAFPFAGNNSEFVQQKKANILDVTAQKRLQIFICILHKLCHCHVWIFSFSVDFPTKCIW